MIAPPATARSGDANAPLVVAGLFSTANGIGEAARATFRALRAAGQSPIAVDLSELLAPVDMVSDIPTQRLPSAKEGTLILQLNGPETFAALHNLGLQSGRNWYIIGYWAWELPHFPVGWDKAFRHLSEIWAISQFTAEAIRLNEAAPPIRVFPHAISPPETVARDREKFQIAEEPFVFLAMADTMSSLERKNPFAAIDAFRQAFGSDMGHQLIIKTRNLVGSPGAEADLKAAIADAPNIRLLDASLSERDRWDLLKSVDAFVSLHRSEGFGLVIAEAMSIGTPVITTGWSGNLDFTCERTAALVPFRKIDCKDPYGVYDTYDSYWADVDVTEASRIMRRLSKDSQFRTEISQAAQGKIRDWASEKRIGELMSARLQSLIADEDATD